MAKILPRYPVYVPSKSRYDICKTAKCLIQDGVPFHLVVEPEELDEYARRYGEDKCLVLPWHYIGVEQLVAVRNFIKDHATEAGYKRHWQIDDNITYFVRRWEHQRIRVDAGVALAATEDFVDRYENVAISGLSYESFAPNWIKLPPFRKNVHVYSCTLVLNSIPNRFRGPRNEDVDICLQVLADGWCTIQMNIFTVRKARTMTMKGGNSGIYQDDGRLKMSRVLERNWPGVVSVARRYGRPHHSVKNAWLSFDNELIPRQDIDFASLPPYDNYGLELVQVADEVKSDRLRQLLNK